MRIPTLLLLSGALAAQIPNGSILITHRDSMPTLAAVKLTILDPTTGALTPLRPAGASLSQLQKGFIVNPGDGTQIWTAPGVSLVGAVSMQRIDLQGSSLVTSKTYSITGAGTNLARYLIVGTDLYLANGTTGAMGGVYKVTIGTTTATQVLVLPSANAMTAIGTKLYVADYAAAFSKIVEVDLVTLQVRTVGSSYSRLRGLTTYGGQLLAGNDNGNLELIHPATGSSTLLSSPGLGAIISVVADGAVGLPVFATANNNVWRFPIYTTPLFTSSGAIAEISGGFKAVAAALAFGTSCAGTPSGRATFGFTGYPVLPTPAFQLTLNNLKATTPGALALGVSRTALGALPLPLDLTVINMPGCWLYQDLLLSFGFVSDGSGVGTIPLPIPGTPGLAGTRLTAQAFVFDPANNPIGITTEGYELVLN